MICPGCGNAMQEFDKDLRSCGKCFAKALEAFKQKAKQDLKAPSDPVEPDLSEDIAWDAHCERHHKAEKALREDLARLKRELALSSRVEKVSMDTIESMSLQAGALSRALKLSESGHSDACMNINHHPNPDIKSCKCWQKIKHDALQGTVPSLCCHSDNRAFCTKFDGHEGRHEYAGEKPFKASISSFTDDYEFLSNFYPSQVKAIYDPPGLVVLSRTVPTVEHAFQAAKSSDPVYFHLTCDAKTPGEAKRLGRKFLLRSDWDSIKLTVMENLIRAKFCDSELRQKLLDTGEAVLIEGNTWGDRYWGVCEGLGENHLGKLLMKIRAEIRKEING